MVGLDGSGNTRKCSPLFKLYSVMPSAEVTFCTPLGRPWAGHSTGARKTAVTRKKLSSLFWFIFLSYPNSGGAGLQSCAGPPGPALRSEEHTSELQSLR